MPESAAAQAQAPTNKPKAMALLASFAATSVAGLAATLALGSARAGLVAASAFAATISAAMLISWGAEAAQFFIAQGFAVALIALLQVMPEFMVEAVIAWRRDIPNMFANATGSNRLLIGLGWPLVYFTTDLTNRFRHGRGAGEIRLRRENVIELSSLLVASSYYLKFLVIGSLTVFDGVLLIAMYGAYMLVLSRLPEEEGESKGDLLAPSRFLAELKPRAALPSLAAVFLVGGAVMVLVANPFVTSLERVAVAWGISTFLFIQWVAPFLSEFPEKVTAFYWSRTIRLAPMALLNLISSVVSQYLLLVGMIPLVYGLSVFLGHVHGGPHGLFGLPIVPMSHELAGEVFLSWAMTLYGCALIARLRLGMAGALSLFVLWIVQFLPDPIHRWTGLDQPTQRYLLGGVCVALAIAHLARHWKEIDLRAALKETVRLMRHRRDQAP